MFKDWWFEKLMQFRVLQRKENRKAVSSWNAKYGFQSARPSYLLWLLDSHNLLSLSKLGFFFSIHIFCTCGNDAQFKTPAKASLFMLQRTILDYCFLRLALINVHSTYHWIPTSAPIILNGILGLTGSKRANSKYLSWYWICERCPFRLSSSVLGLFFFDFPFLCSHG